MFRQNGSQLTVEVEPSEFVESHDLFALSDQSCVPLVRNGRGSKLELADVDPLLLKPGERPRVHLLLVPK